MSRQSDQTGLPSSTLEMEIKLARRLVAEAKDIVAFTGAGISAESGIHTYRDMEESLWERFDPQQVVQIDAFLNDSRPFWHFFKDCRYQAIRSAKANQGHLVLAELERSGKLKALITQNIDGLHQEAGSRQVIELHGNTRQISCLDCASSYTMEEVYLLLGEQLPPPCRNCGGRLKPDVVFFGEGLPPEALERAAQAASDCDLMMVIGSSLQVYPAAFLPESAKNNGARLIIVNKTPTMFDHLTDALLCGNAAHILPEVIEWMR